MVRIRDLAKNWDEAEEKRVKEALKGLRGIKGGLRHKVAVMLAHFDERISRIDHMVKRLQERDKQLYQKLVEAQTKGDKERAAIYAGEIAELRKMARRLLRAQTALEQVKLRVETVRDLGELTSIMYYIRPLMREIQGQLKDIVPEIAFDIGTINQSLLDTVLDLESQGLGAASTSYSYTPMLDAEAKKVLEEAAAVAEAKMNDKFPTIKQGKG